MLIINYDIMLLGDYMKSKNYSISVIRLIAMLMIISCHILQGLQNNWAFWVNIGVQIFLFISGYLYSKKDIDNIGDFYKRQIKKIMIPFIIVFVVSLLLEIFILNNTYSIGKIVGCLFGFGAFVGNISILSHTWFVSYILICYMLIPVFQKIFKSDDFKKNLLYLILIMIFIQALKVFSVVNIEASWVNNYLLGYFYGRCCSKKKNENVFLALIGLAAIVVLPLAIIYQEGLNVSLPGIINSCSIMIINYGHVLLGTIVFILLYKVLNKFTIKQNIVLSFSDKYSYYIYLVHQIFILNSFAVLFLTDYLVVNIILIFGLSIVSAIVVKFISDLILKSIN